MKNDAVQIFCIENDIYVHSYHVGQDVVRRNSLDNDNIKLNNILNMQLTSGKDS